MPSLGRTSKLSHAVENKFNHEKQTKQKSKDRSTALGCGVWLGFFLKHENQS
jgi:hypothetical protein